jgi:predicted DNA-binding protein (MmcQ/YjbR family)
MDLETIRSYCISLPHVTEDIQWDHDLLFRVGGKIFAGVELAHASPNRLSFKCTPEKYAELIERDGIIPAPYVAKYHWVAVERMEALSGAEIKDLIRGSYDLVYAKLPKRLKLQLGES